MKVNFSLNLSSVQWPSPVSSNIPKASIKLKSYFIANSILMLSRLLERLSKSSRYPTSVEVSSASSTGKFLRRFRCGSMYLLFSSAYYALNSSIPWSLLLLERWLFFLWGGFLCSSLYYLAPIRASYSLKSRLWSVLYTYSCPLNPSCLSSFWSKYILSPASTFFGVGDSVITCSLGSNLVLMIWELLSMWSWICSGDLSLRGWQPA